MDQKSYRQLVESSKSDGFGYTGNTAQPAPFSPIIIPHEKLMEEDPIDAIFCVKDLAVKSGLTILSGDPAAGKTFFALFLAIAVSQGSKMMDQFETKQGSVLWIDEESGKNRILRRLKTDIKAPANLPITYSFEERFKINEDAHYEWLKAYVESNHPELIVIDSFRTIHDAEENDSKEMTEVTGRLRTIASLGPAILLIHHNRKQMGVEKVSGASMRGSSSILANIDYQLQLRKVMDYVVLEQNKARDSEPMSPVKFQFQKDETTEALTIKNYGEFDEKKKITEELKERIPAWLATLSEPVTKDAIKQQFSEVSGIRNIDTSVQELVKQLKIQRFGKGKSTRYGATGVAYGFIETIDDSSLDPKDYEIPGF